MSKIIQLPGLIDIHVHLRDPGETHKENFYTGTMAAIHGGITTVFDLPTKSFHVLTEEELELKIKTVSEKALCDFALFFGTDGNNINFFERISCKVIGLKIYLTETTGHILLSEDLLEEILINWPKKKVIMVHTDERKIENILDTALKFGNKVHITHVNSKYLLKRIIEAKKDSPNITCDTTPHHLLLTSSKAKKLGGFGMMIPPIQDVSDQTFLWDNLKFIDCIATDHAPHTKEEKESNKPPTGVPGLETMLPLLYTAVCEGKMGLSDLIEKTNVNPQKIFNFRQNKNTTLELETEKEYMLKNEDLFTKCGWTPFHGWEVRGKVINVWIKGKKVFEKGKVVAQKGSGRNIMAS